MYTLLLLFIYLGCYVWYHTSAKTKSKSNIPWIVGLTKDKKRAISVSILIFLITWVAIMYLQGILAGTFAFVTYLMGIFSLIVLLAPYKYIQLYQLLVIVVVSLSLEILIF